jgi:hypothetical protein
MKPSVNEDFISFQNIILNIYKNKSVNNLKLFLGLSKNILYLCPLK